MRTEEEDGLSGFIHGVDWCQMGTPVFRKPHNPHSFNGLTKSFNGLTKRKYWKSCNAPSENRLLLSEKNGQIASSWEEGSHNSNNHSLHPRYAEKHVWNNNTLNLKADTKILQQHMTTRCYSCQLRTGNWGYNLHRLTKIVREMIGKALPGLMSLHFYCNIWMVLHPSPGKTDVQHKENKNKENCPHTPCSQGRRTKKTTATDFTTASQFTKAQKVAGVRVSMAKTTNQKL